MEKDETPAEAFLRITLLLALSIWGVATIVCFSEPGIIFLGTILLFVRFWLFMWSRLSRDLAKITVWSYWDISYNVIPSYYLVFGLDNMMIFEPYTVFFGQAMILIAAVFMFSVEAITGRSRVQKTTYVRDRAFTLPKYASVAFWIISGFALLSTLISHSIGIAELGTRTGTFTKLPLKLEAIINVSRNVYIPILFVFFVFLFLGAKNKKMVFASAILLAFWGLFEMYVRFSKGFFFVATMPLFFLLIHERRLKIWMLCTVFTSLCVWIFIYPFIAALRNATQTAGALTENMEFVFSMVNNDYAYSLVTVLKRICTDAVYLQNVLGFHRFGQPAIQQIHDVIQFGGEAAYYTRVVVGSDLLHFSAGMSGAPGGYLMYGYVGLIVAVAAISILAAWSDCLRNSRVIGNNFNRAVFCFLIYLMVSSEFYSIFYLARDFAEIIVPAAVILFISYRFSRRMRPIHSRIF